MARRLPDDPEKRRLQVFKRCYQNLQHWEALREDRGMSDVMTSPDGEDIFLGDLLVGLPYLPTRQRQAFELICLRGYTETAARDELLPNSKSSTPVQQYADSGLVRMVAAYDAKQRGDWPPAEISKPKPMRRFIMAALHPVVTQHLEEARRDIMAQMDGLKVALSQVEEMMGGAKAKNNSQPAPNPKPEGRPTLTDAAKELAQTG
jgi:hypothetical protein